MIAAAKRISGLQWGYSKLRSEVVQRLHELRRERDAFAPLLHTLLVALLARHPDALDAGHPLGRAQVSHQAVDLALELVEVAEGRGIDGDDRLSRIGRGA